MVAAIFLVKHLVNRIWLHFFHVTGAFGACSLSPCEAGAMQGLLQPPARPVLGEPLNQHRMGRSEFQASQLSRW